MGRKTKLGLTLGATAVIVLTGTGWALASDGEDPDDTPIEGAALQRAEDAALAETGGGTVSSTEVDGDAEGYYEVEVSRNDGSQVEVNLDRDFQVLGTEDESDERDD
jgi:uncharacterized membrane protein YkoI